MATKWSLTIYRGKNFGEELSRAEIRAYVEVYRDQLTDVLKDLGSVNHLTGDQVVQLAVCCTYDTAT